MANIQIKNLKLLNGKNISLSLEENEKYVLKGPSGSGKSLLLKQMILLYPTEFSEYIFFREDIKTISRTRLRSIMLFLPQKPSFEKEKVRDILARPFKFHEHLGKNLDLKLVNNLLERFKLNSNFLEEDSKKLSGGQEQIVQLIRALCLKPKVLLIDEGLSALDQERTKVAEEILNELKLTLLMVSHHQTNLIKLNELTFSQLQV